MLQGSSLVVGGYPRIPDQQTRGTRHRGTPRHAALFRLAPRLSEPLAPLIPAGLCSWAHPLDDVRGASFG